MYDLKIMQLPLALCADSWYDGYSAKAYSLNTETYYNIR